MSFPVNQTTAPQGCASVREEFSAYLDGALSGVMMQAMAAHLDDCKECAEEFTAWRQIQISLAAMGPAKAPASLQSRLRAALAEERDRGTHLGLYHRLHAMWQATLGPLVFRYAAGTAVALLLVGGLSTMAVWVSVPPSVQANDETLGAMTAPRYLYSEVPPQPIEFGREVPILVEALVDDQGRVYDYTILTGPTDVRVERRLQANLLSSVFRPATVFGQPVAGHVVMTYTGVSVKG